MTRKRNYEYFEDAYRVIYTCGYRGWWEVQGYGPNSLKKATRHLKQRILRYGFVPRSGTTLELGCGDGIMTVALAKQGYRATGIDISPTVIRQGRVQAKQYCVNPRFIVGDVTRMNKIKTASLDLVLDMNCLHIIIKKTHRVQFLKEVRRVLKPQGVFYICTMTTPMSEPYASEMEEEKELRSGSLWTVSRTVRGKCVTYQMPLVKRAILPKEHIFQELLACGLTPVRWQHRKTRTISDLFVWAVRDENRSIKPSRKPETLLA